MAPIVTTKLLLLLNHHCNLHTEAACSLEYSEIRNYPKCHMVTDKEYWLI